MKMLKPNPRRLLARPRAIVYLAVSVVAFYVLLTPPLFGDDVRLLPLTSWGRKKPVEPPPAPPPEPPPREELDPYASELRDRFEAEEQALAE